MPLFKKKVEAIPPVEEHTSRAPSYRSNTSHYNASRDGDPYNAPATQYSSYGRTADSASLADKYSNRRPINPSAGASDDNRNELFSGYNPAKAGSGRFFDGPAIKDPTGEETEEDVEGIKTQTRFAKQESVSSTRNALRLAREAEETARNTVARLGDQSEKLANTERHLDVSKGHSQRAADKTDELKQLNRSIFRPVISFNKDARRAAQEAKVQARYEEEQDEREKAMLDIRQTQDRLGRAASYGRSNDEEELLGSRSSRMGNADHLAARKEQRKRYQFEASASDDELEDELDDNLNEIGDMTKRLKALGMAMGQELDNQNARIDRISDKAVALDGNIFRNTERLKKIK